MATAVSPRATAILGRFQSSFDARDATKVLAYTVDRLARELDVAASDVGRIRRNHRLGAADNEWSLLGLAGLHDLAPADFALLGTRLAAVATASDTLLGSPADATTAAEVRASLPDLLGVAADSFPRFPEEADDVGANGRLGAALGAVTRYASEVDALRHRIGALAGLHQVGNGGVSCLLVATAVHLGIDVVERSDHDERYWHFARCEDHFRLVEPQPTDPPTTRELAPVADLIALEENPFHAADIAPVARAHGQRFAVTRAGWEEVPVTVRVVGIGERTCGPMVVNVDTGAGLAFVGAVPSGSQLLFDATGLTTLDGLGVQHSCYSFHGAVFADSGGHVNDFVWADAADPAAGTERAGTFAVSSPYASAFEPDAVFPHAGGQLDAPTLLVGTTRWAFFVREAHFGVRSGGEDLPASPAFLAGRWDETVFDTDEAGGAQPSAEVGFEWQEREAFAACVWLPRRFESLDTDGQVSVAEQVRLLLDRFRPVGVHLYVKYADDRWTLGTGVLRDVDTTEPLGTVVAGTGLWPTTE